MPQTYEETGRTPPEGKTKQDKDPASYQQGRVQRKPMPLKPFQGKTPPFVGPPQPPPVGPPRPPETAARSLASHFTGPPRVVSGRNRGDWRFRPVQRRPRP